MPTALVIGASRGIGREYARQLVQDGWKTYATARDATALEELRAEGAEVLKLDVAKPESLAALGWQLDGVKLDLVLYVAGLLGPQQDAKEPPSAADFDAVMHTNVLGAMQVTPLLAPSVEAAGGQFVFVTSGMGSIAESAESGPWWLYRVSKAALNMAVKSAAFDYPKATFVAMCPGWVQTDMGGPNATTPVDVCVADMRRVLKTLKRSDSGIYINHAGRLLPW
ncbi:MAG TPA: SDR family oxidoreductase [Burkholderiaceae bacterium]|jgi:NAD(P)-dependent dehydrogenase (short-subunit alcohol dehydrogenase family)